MISRLEAYRYRCFSTLALELGGYHVLAGANGSGKTTLLDLPALLGDLLAQGVVSDAFLVAQPSRGVPRAHTLDELVHQERGPDFVFAVEGRLPHDVVRLLLEASSDAVRDDARRWPSHVRYEVRLEVFNHVELHVAAEYLFLFPETQAPELGGGLQGEPESLHASGRPRLRRRDWRSIVHRDRGQPAVFSEEVSPRSRPLSFRVPPTQLALPSVPYDRGVFPAALWLRDVLREKVVFYEPDWRGQRRASPPGQPPRLLPSGSNLAWLALGLQENDSARFEYWVEHVKTALPQVADIRAVEREEDHHAYFAVDYDGRYTVTSSGLSDGTLRVLALTLVPYLDEPPAVLITEEPENGVHPQGIEAVLQSLSSVYDRQVWISTHSPVVIAQTKLSQVLCMRMHKDGAVAVVPGDEHPRLREWKKSVGRADLGTLFAAGILG